MYSECSWRMCGYTDTDALHRRENARQRYPSGPFPLSLTFFFLCLLFSSLVLFAIFVAATSLLLYLCSAKAMDLDLEDRMDDQTTRVLGCGYGLHVARLHQCEQTGDQ